MTSSPAKQPAGQPGAKFPVGVARERVRDLHAKGLSPRDIARVLDVSTQAVNYHLARIREEASA